MRESGNPIAYGRGSRPQEPKQEEQSSNWGNTNQGNSPKYQAETVGWGNDTNTGFGQASSSQNEGGWDTKTPSRNDFNNQGDY